MILPFFLYLYTMRRQIHILPFITGVFIVLLLTTCEGSDVKVKKPVIIPQDLLQEGDVVFRRGTGLASRIVLTADSKGIYSHTGILKKKKDKWYVIHAVPGEPDFKDEPDRVKMEEIEKFFTPSKAISGAVMRVEGDSATCCRAAARAESFYKANVLFDHHYNLEDTTEMYCTELIDYVYRNEGIDLVEGRISKLSLPGFNGDYLLPNDIAQSKKLCIIYYF